MNDARWFYAVMTCLLLGYALGVLVGSAADWPF